MDFSKLNGLKNVIIENRFLTNEEFENYLDLSDVVLLPYSKISQSGILLSLISKRKPILVSNLEGLKEPFKFGKVGWILEELSSKNLAKKLEEISRNLQEIEEIKKSKVWNKLDEYYDWKSIGEKTTKMYKEVIYNEK